MAIFLQPSLYNIFFYKIAQFLPYIAQYQLFLFMFCLFLVNGYSPLIRRCDKLLFMSTEADDDLGAVALQNITSGRASLWNKTRAVSPRAFGLGSTSNRLSLAYRMVWKKVPLLDWSGGHKPKGKSFNLL